MTQESATDQVLLSPPPRPAADGSLRRRLFLAGALLTTFVCGGIVGASLMFHFNGPGRPPWGSPNDDPPKRMLTQLQKKLQLSEEQSPVIEKILRDHWALLEELRRETFPRIEASFEQLREDISSALEPGQRPGWEEHYKDMKSRMPPHHGGGPRHHGPGSHGPRHDGLPHDGPPPDGPLHDGPPPR